MRTTTYLLLGLMLLSLNACASRTSDQSDGLPPLRPQYAVDFVFDGKLKPLLERAREENKPVFLDIYTDWCLPCKLMDKDVFVDREIGKYMNKNFINYKVNAEKGHGVNLAALFEVKGYPTLLFLNPDGKVLVRKTGAAYQSELRRLGDEALDKMRGNDGM